MTSQYPIQQDRIELSSTVTSDLIPPPEAPVQQARTNASQKNHPVTKGSNLQSVLNSDVTRLIALEAQKVVALFQDFEKLDRQKDELEKANQSLTATNKKLIERVKKLEAELNQARTQRNSKTMFVMMDSVHGENLQSNHNDSASVIQDIQTWKEECQKLQQKLEEAQGKLRAKESILGQLAIQLQRLGKIERQHIQCSDKEKHLIKDIEALKNQNRESKHKEAEFLVQLSNNAETIDSLKKTAKEYQQKLEYLDRKTSELSMMPSSSEITTRTQMSFKVQPQNSKAEEMALNNRLKIVEHIQKKYPNLSFNEKRKKYQQKVKMFKDVIIDKISSVMSEIPPEILPPAQ